MIERIADDSVPFIEQRLEQSAVRIEAGTVENGVVGAQKFTGGLFESFMRLMGAADEPDRRHAITIDFDSIDGRLLYIRMIRQPKIIVCAEIDDLALGHSNFGALRAED